MHSAVAKEVSFEINDLTYAAKLWGDDSGHPVIALHGWLDNANSFDRIIPCVPGLNVCALDLAGHGRSGHRPGWGQYYFYDHVYDVLEVAKALGWTKFSLLGHSMGAHVAMVAAALMPEQVDKLFLIDGFGVPRNFPASVVPDLAREAYLKAQSLKLKQAPVYKSIDEMVATRRRGFLQINEQAARILCERAIKPVEGGYTWSSDPKLKYMSPFSVNHQEFCEYVKLIEAPTGLILADGTTHRDEAMIQQRIDLHRNLQVYRLSAGHHLHMEDEYLQVVDIMKTFFA